MCALLSGGMAPPFSLRYREGCQPPMQAHSALKSIAFCTLLNTTIHYNSLHTVNKESHMFYSLLELIVWGRKSRTWRHWIYGKQTERKQRRQLKELSWLLLYGWPDREGL